MTSCVLLVHGGLDNTIAPHSYRLERVLLIRALVNKPADKQTTGK